MGFLDFWHNHKKAIIIGCIIAAVAIVVVIIIIIWWKKHKKTNETKKEGYMVWDDDPLAPMNQQLTPFDYVKKWINSCIGLPIPH